MGYVIMEIKNLTLDDVGFFFNKYKYNSELIVNLERRLFKESYSYAKWHSMLTENSQLTRRLFSENDTILNKYLFSVLEHPQDLRDNTTSFYLLHVLFFLFENHNDLLITNKLVRALQKNEYCFCAKGIFDSSLDLGISNVISQCGDSKVADDLFNKARFEYDANQNKAENTTKVHLMFCLLFQLLNQCLSSPVDLSRLIQTVYDASEYLEHKMNDEVYAQMWNGATDFHFHVELLKRFFKIYGIFGWLSSDIDSCAIASWISEEFLAEQKEGRINSMIFTAYQKMRLVTHQITREQYITNLTNQYLSIRKATTAHFSYPENSFPNDDDPVSDKFADLLDTVKIFSESFSFVFFFMQEIFISSNDEQVKKQIYIDTEQYYIQMPYASKGIDIDSFVAQNTLTILQHCDTVESCLSFINIVFLHRQISTAIHSSMVGKLSLICFEHFFTARPDLFANIPGCSTKQDIVTYLINASFCHDIGKLYCTNLVNLHFRRITDEEFALLSEHAEKGATLIEKVPLLKNYADIVRGHHKSFDGQRGYPSSFDNTKSPYKILIDLITMCDSIDAATDMLGRNYAKGKSFSVLLEELQSGAGTRYSPELVKLLVQDKTLCTQINEITGSGRTTVYFDMYTQYISPHINFSSQDEKNVVPYTKEYLPALIQFYQKTYPNITDETILNEHLSCFTNNPHCRGYILIDKRKIVYGALFGHFIMSLGDKLPSGKTFYIEELLILPEIRRKGFGTELIRAIENDLIANDCIKLSIDVTKDFHEESFFWINGFSDSKIIRMEKSIDPSDTSLS